MQDKANHERQLRHCLSFANIAILVRYLFFCLKLWLMQYPPPGTPHAITSSCTSSREPKVGIQHTADHWAIPHPTQTTDGKPTVPQNCRRCADKCCYNLSSVY
ncbi:Lignostilbene-alpha,beta-dioxygenase isozyme III [Fusarium oxysporum f. sp. albedinis]|nr:Lignostilbene-alpha,beta-dioxygenase isozyme III [Fusarium oxysporum f. sp. albedinis]